LNANLSIIGPRGVSVPAQVSGHNTRHYLSLFLSSFLINLQERVIVVLRKFTWFLIFVVENIRRRLVRDFKPYRGIILTKKGDKTPQQLNIYLFFKNCHLVPKSFIWVCRGWGGCLKVTLQTCAPENFCSPQWGVEQGSRMSWPGSEDPYHCECKILMKAQLNYQRLIIKLSKGIQHVAV
jgi:hypothetical protein